MKGRCNTADRIARLRKAVVKLQWTDSFVSPKMAQNPTQQPEGNFGTKFPVAMTALLFSPILGIVKL